VLRLRAAGNIQPGDWDLDRFPVERMAKYKSVVQHFQDGVDWRDTDLFRRYEQRFRDGGSVRWCHSIEELADVYRAEMDKMYAEMRDNGFSLRRPVSLWGILDIQKKNRLAQVYVGRDGEVIFGVEGNHRFAMARLLKLDRIPCRVVGRHADWQNLRERLFRTELSLRKVEAGALAGHPDLQDLLEPAGTKFH